MIPFLTLAAGLSAKPPNLWAIALGTVAGLFAVALIVLFLVRRLFQNNRKAEQEDVAATPRAENASAFMAASMQGVIQKLRDQEKELERLHREERERAAHSERLSEEVTRNMPAGVLGVNKKGIIANANPAAAQTLGIRTLGFQIGRAHV